MSFHRKSFLVWLALMISVGASAIVAAHFDQPMPQVRGDAMVDLIEAARAHAKDLRKSDAAEEADRWENLATAAQVELEWRRLNYR